MKINKIKLVTTIAISIVFAVTTFTTVYLGAGKLLNTGFKHIFGVEEYNCRYPTIIDKGEIIEPNCPIDTNQMKRDLAESLAMLLVSAPISIYSYKQLRKK